MIRYLFIILFVFVFPFKAWATFESASTTFSISNTGTYTIDIDLNGETPVAVLFWGSSSTDEIGASAVADMMITYGASVGSSEGENWAISGTADDNESNSDCYRSSSTDYCIIGRNNAGSTSINAKVNSFGADYVKIDVDTYIWGGTSTYWNVIAFAGTEITGVSAFYIDVVDIDILYDRTLTFTTELAFCASPTNNTTQANDASVSFGWTTNQGGVTEANGFSYYNQTGQASGTLGGELFEGYPVGQMPPGGEHWVIHVEDYTNKFEIVARDNADTVSNERVFVLAMAFDGNISLWTDNVTFDKDDSGSTTFELNCGFTPDSGLVILTDYIAENTHYANDYATSVGMGYLGTNPNSAQGRSDDGPGMMEENRYTSGVTSVMVWSSVKTKVYDARWTAWANGGFTLNVDESNWGTDRMLPVLLWDYTAPAAAADEVTIPPQVIISEKEGRKWAFASQ